MTLTWHTLLNMVIRVKYTGHTIYQYDALIGD